jgi:hypothetical protein
VYDPRYKGNDEVILIVIFIGIWHRVRV